MSLTITEDGILNVAYPGQPDETHIIQAPLGAKWTLTADGTTGVMTAVDIASGEAAVLTLYDPNGTPWEVAIDDSGLLSLNGFDKNILLAPVVNSPVLLDGRPATGYFLFALIPGTELSATTYRNGAFISVQPIPIVLNAFGLPTDPVFLVSGVEYDFRLVSPEGGEPVKSWRAVRTGHPSDVSVITEWSLDTQSATYQDGSSFAINGDARAVFRSGRRVQLTQSSIGYGVILSSSYDGVRTLVSVLLDSGAVDQTLLSVTAGLLSPSFGAIPGRRHIGLSTFFAGDVTVPLADGVNILTAGTMGLLLKPLPSGWLECNGQAVSRTTYSELFAQISTTFGAGNGTTTFNVPTVATTGMGANAATTTSINAGNFVYAIYAQG